MEEQSRAAEPLSCLAFGSLIAALLLYLALVVSISSMTHQAPDIVTPGIAGLSGLLLWIPLGFFATALGRRAKAGQHVQAVMLFLLLGGAVSSIFVVDMSESFWVRLNPYLLPPLTLLFALWIGKAIDLRLGRRAGMAGFAAAGLALMAAPFVEWARWDEAALEEKYERRKAEEDAGWYSSLQELDPRGGLEPFLTFLNFGDTERGNNLRRRAIARVRTIPSRQADTVRLLQQGRLGDLADMWQFDLAPDAALCRAYGAAVDRHLADPRWPDQIESAFHMMPQERNIEWLVRGGCDLSGPGARLADQARKASGNLGMVRDFGARVEALLARPRG